jgi:dihydrofolate synthase/folylpolyglutamate synthase
MKEKIKNLAEFNKFILDFVPRKDKLFPAQYGLSRTNKFLALLDNPQNKLNVIHIAGTSGKGSTAFYTSHIIKSQGFKTGLILSPHLVDIRERFQINNSLLAEKKIVSYFNKLIPIIKKFNALTDSPLSYFELITIFGFYIFHLEKVDFAIIETGLGGTYDATNCINNRNKLVVLTNIGLDHTEILGKTIAKIAHQKAGIIHYKNKVISIQQPLAAKKIIEKVARQHTAPLYRT